MSSFRRSAYNLTERELRWAIANSSTNIEASELLHVSYKTFREYAKKYFDAETGKTLFEIHGNARRRYTWKKNDDNLVEDILAGKRNWMHKRKVEDLLVRECALLQDCVYCGECERRITDNKPVTLLVWKDGNYNNHKRENLEFVCYNHFFLYYGDLRPHGFYKAHHQELYQEYWDAYKKQKEDDRNKNQSK